MTLKKGDKVHVAFHGPVSSTEHLLKKGDRVRAMRGTCKDHEGIVIKAGTSTNWVDVRFPELGQTPFRYAARALERGTLELIS